MNPLDFLLSPLGRLIGVGAVCLLVGGFLGYRIEYGALQALKTANAKAQAAAVQLALDDQRTRDKITHDTDVKFAEEHQKIITNTITIIKKVPVHVTPQIDAAFPVSCAFIRVRDAAALQADPDTLSLPAGLTDASSCPVATSALATADVEAIGAYYAVSSQLVALQDWVSAQEHH